MTDSAQRLELAKRLENMARHQRENLSGKVRFNNFLNGKLADEAAAALRSSALPETGEDWSCVADFLDDIEVDDKGMCRWADIANAQTNIRHTMRAVQRPRPSPDGAVRVHRSAESADAPIGQQKSEDDAL